MLIGLKVNSPDLNPSPPLPILFSLYASKQKIQCGRFSVVQEAFFVEHIQLYMHATFQANQTLDVRGVAFSFKICESRRSLAGCKEMFGQVVTLLSCCTVFQLD